MNIMRPLRSFEALYHPAEPLARTGSDITSRRRKRDDRFALLVVSAGAVLPLFARSDEAQQPSVIAGEATAVDGDTLIVDGHRIRIHDLHAPDAGEPGGAAAKGMAALAIYGEYVVCKVAGADHVGRVVADCTMSSDGADFAEVMIRAGHADHCQGRPDLASLPDNGFNLPDDCR